MPRDGSGTYSAPAGTTATSTTTIESAPYNSFVADLEALANEARPVSAGGTGEASITAIQTSFKIAPTDAAVTITGDWTLSGAVVMGGAVDMSGATLTLPDDVVSTAKVEDAAITEAKLAADAVTTGKVADSAVTFAKLSSDAVVTAAEGLTANNNDTSVATPAAVLGQLAQVLIVADEKANGTDGGTFTTGDWRTRDLNTVRTNNIAGASIASNQIILPAGTYMVDAAAPGFAIDRNVARLRNVSDSLDVLIGTSTYQGDDTSWSEIIGEFTLAATKTLEIQSRCSQTITGEGFGRAAGFGVAEVYTIAKFTKIA